MDKLVKMGIIIMTAMVLVACGGDTDSTTDVSDTTDGVEEVEEDAEEEEESLYTYEDFKGVYVGFEGEPYRTPINSMSSGIIVLEDNYYQTFNRWDFDMTSTIIGKKIEDNVLTLRLDSDEQEQWGLHSESGSEKFKLNFEGNKRLIRPTSTEESLYSMTSEDLQTHYDQLEIDYARIIMTFMGKPSLDSWALWETDNGIPVIRIRHSSKGDSVRLHDGVTYPVNVTHIDLTHQGHEYGVITYSTIGDGNIKKYFTPSQLSHDEQYLQYVINNPEEVYITPFEPYEVADLIGRVNFDYQY